MRIPIRSRVRRLWRLATGYIPRQCVQCGRWTFDKDAAYERHRVRGFVPLCLPCHTDLYIPSRGGRGQEKRR